ncbi:jhy protein homolog [Hippoglossus stenolepis]|uniref:jhy protein homolog n=1 Tax=Hippoglossus stenolepis TaxID=195615 RepID=UPI00159C35C8|nr:jhy protein homolog [Hippoglossus stenolepis]XP_035034699.1 jhy protein homolog [Hippoglossus stenolepis]
MDQGLGQGRMCAETKAEQRRQAVPANQWESGESDTERLAQERAYQQQLQMHIGHLDQNTEKENAESLLQGDDEDDTEDLQVYDSLDVASNLHTKRNPALQQTEYLDTQMDERGGSRLLPDDTYSDLRYDPSWRTNVKGNGRFIESPQNSVEGYPQVPEEKPAHSYDDGQALGKKGGYRYIVDTSPPVVTPHTAGNKSDQPYRLHPEDGLTSTAASHHGHKHACQSRSPEAHLSEASTKKENVSSLQRGIRENYERSFDSEHFSGSPNMREDLHGTEFRMHYQQLRCTQRGPIQEMSTSTLPNPNVSSNNKLQSLVEDKVKLNKITLGCSRSKHGSYVRVHARKQMPNVNDVQETLKKPAPAENQQDSSDPELRLLQKTQQLRVTQISKGKKGQCKEYPNPSRRQPPAVAVKAERGDCLSVPLAQAAAVTQPEPQKTTSSQPLPPTIHLNINLNTSSHLLSLLQQKDGQDAIINLASLHGHPHWSPTSELQLALSTGYQQKNNSRKSFFMSREVLNTQLLHQNLESSPEQWQRTRASQLPLSCEKEEQTRSPLRTPTTASSQGTGSYSVLPPIGKPLTGEEPGLSPCQSENTAFHIHSSNSDSYLVQMEKQKQLRARVNCKAYKQMRTDKNHRGLCPDYAAIEKTKMKRQKLYSNVIREQNKKMSRIPFLPAKDPEGSDNKVPRIKALEYAKTIAKPPVKSQPKQRQKFKTEDFTELAPLWQGSDMSLLTKLEVLRKRHEEEKLAVALFGKGHAV